MDNKIVTLKYTHTHTKHIHYILLSMIFFFNMTNTEEK